MTDTDHELERAIVRKERETPDTLAELRTKLSTLAERIDGAEKMKLQANEQLAAEQYDLAMRLYLAALWLLRPDDTPLPAALASKQLPTGVSLLPALDAGPTNTVRSGESESGEGAAGTTDEQPATVAEQAAAESRRILHLNVAACALKRDDWLIAEAASERVLEHDPSNQKALFRIAKAHEGAGELSAAMSVCARLLKGHPTNQQAARLLETLKRRQQQQKKMFGGLFERAAGSGAPTDGLYSEAALKEEARRREEERDRLLKLENLAKLPTEMWQQQLGALGPEKMEKMLQESREVRRACRLRQHHWP